MDRGGVCASEYVALNDRTIVNNGTNKVRAYMKLPQLFLGSNRLEGPQFPRNGLPQYLQSLREERDFLRR
jgi:hypothetical protein